MLGFAAIGELAIGESGPPIVMPPAFAGVSASGVAAGLRPKLVLVVPSPGAMRLS